MINDPIGDTLTRIKNAYMARRGNVEVPQSRLKEALLGVLGKLGYVGEVTQEKHTLVVTLLYNQGEPALSGTKRLSKPGLRRYVSVWEIRKMRKGLGHLILSTPKGLKTHIEAQREQVGGELLCKVW